MADWKEPTEAELLEQLAAARENAAEADRLEPRATSAAYDAAAGLVRLTMRSGLQVAFTPAMLGELGGAGPAELAQVGLTPHGDALTCPPLDVHVYVPGLLADLTGLSDWWQRQSVSRAGRATSEAKARAARDNGRKGGRPRKNPAPPERAFRQPQSRALLLREERVPYPKPDADEPEGTS
jgi:hypothetical protein